MTYFRNLKKLIEMSSINMSSDDPLYQIYRKSGPTPAIIIPALLFLIFGYAGVIMNCIVVFITLSTKTLHGTANFLLAMISMFEVLHQSGHAIFFFIAASGTNFISQYLAVRLELPMIFGLNCSLCGMACAAFDRLFAVVAQSLHSRLNKPLYLAVHLAICAVYGFQLCFTVFQHYTFEDPSSPTTGCVSELLDGEVGEIFFRDTIILNLLCTLLYCLLWVVIRFKKGVTKETNGRLLKSLVIILLINIGGYFITLSVYQVLFHMPPATLNPVVSWHIGFVSGVLLNVGVGCNAAVLYVSSTEYRKAFKRHLAVLGKKVGLSQQEWIKQNLRLRTTQVNPQLSRGHADTKGNRRSSSQPQMIPVSVH